MSAPMPKPAARGPKPKRPLKRTQLKARRTRPRRQSKRPAAVKRRRKDGAWSRLVRLRVDGRCEWPECKAIGIAAHHVKGKKAHPRLRYVECNGIALCHWHHRGSPDSAHERPMAFRRWFAAYRPKCWAEIQSLLKGHAS